MMSEPGVQSTGTKCAAYIYIVTRMYGVLPQCPDPKDNGMGLTEEENIGSRGGKYQASGRMEWIVMR